MSRTNHTRITLAAVTIAVLGFAFGIGTSAFDSSPTSAAGQLSTYISDAEFAALEPAAAAGEYYMVRQDMRRCASPRCGGYFVSRVNQSRTRCADRLWMRECYVAEIDWNGQTEIESGRALLRGDIVNRRFPRFGNLGAFRVTESWQSPSARPGTGTFYRARDRGVRCITHPCLTHAATKLNAGVATNVAGVDLAESGANGEMISQAAAAMTQPDGVLVSGYFSNVSGPAGRAQTLKATAFYLRAGAEVGGPDPGSKRCFRTGCSSQVCADQDVVTTCEYRPEYECYQRAICERQRSGECGFRMTPELRACLARARR